MEKPRVLHPLVHRAILVVAGVFMVVLVFLVGYIVALQQATELAVLPTSPPGQSRRILPAFTVSPTAGPLFPTPVPTATPTPTPTPTPPTPHTVTINDISVSLDPYGGGVDEVPAPAAGGTTTLYVHGSASHNTACTPIGTPIAYTLEVYPAADGSCAASSHCITGSFVSAVQCPAGTNPESARFQFHVTLSSVISTGSWVARATVNDQDGSGASASASHTFTLGGS